MSFTFSVLNFTQLIAVCAINQIWLSQWCLLVYCCVYYICFYLWIEKLLRWVKLWRSMWIEWSHRKFCGSLKEFCLSLCSEMLRAFCLLFPNWSHSEEACLCLLRRKYGECCPLTALYKARRSLEMAWERHGKMQTEVSADCMNWSEDTLVWGASAIILSFMTPNDIMLEINKVRQKSASVRIQTLDLRAREIITVPSSLHHVTKITVMSLTAYISSWGGMQIFNCMWTWNMNSIWTELMTFTGLQWWSINYSKTGRAGTTVGSQ